LTTGLEIVAAGARTPVGLTAETSAAAVRAGISRLREFSFIDANGKPIVLGTDPRLDQRAQGRARMWPMLEAVLDEILRKAGPGPARLAHGCNVLLALPEPRPGFPDADAQWLRQATQAHLDARGVSSRVVIAGRGHAGALSAIHQATQRVAQRRAQPEDPVFLILGLDSHHHPDTLLWLEAEQRLALEGIPNGFIPGEAAGGLLLTTKALRSAWRLPCLAVVAGAGVAQESLSRTSETGSFGIGMHHAVTQAAGALSLPADAADTVYCDINGERYRSEEWGFFALRGYRAIRSLAYLSPSDCWGDVGAAFGPLASILATESFARGYATGPRALVMAGSESGLRGAVFLQSP
jgi:3-oxoacyl-[acyl-carrier-protein] synthase-1